MTPTENTVSLYDAKTHLSQLGERAARGEVIVVTKHGKPSFRIIALEKSSRRMPGGNLLGMPSEERDALAAVDWFEPDEQLERDFGMRE